MHDQYVANEPQKPSAAKRPSADGCLFVANLPAFLSNEELTEELWKIFQKYGTVISIKASRDAKGRPFGFIQFSEAKDAVAASKDAIFLGKRKIRIEKARCLRKLIITIPSPDNKTDFAKLLQPWFHESDIVVSEELEPHISMIAKLKDDIDAEEALQKLRASFPEWSFEWFSNLPSTATADLSSMNGHTSSAQQYPFINNPPYNLYHYYHPFWMSMAVMMGGASPPPSLASYEDITLAMDRLAVSPPPPPIYYNCGSPPGLEPEIFVGRLNSTKATADNLREIFSKYGEIESIQIVNRSQCKFSFLFPAITPPQDSFAFIRFTTREAARSAIEEENGKLRMGQTLRVTWALTNVKAKNVLPVCSPELGGSRSMEKQQHWNQQLMSMMMYPFNTNQPANGHARMMHKGEEKQQPITQDP